GRVARSAGGGGGRSRPARPRGVAAARRGGSKADRRGGWTAARRGREQDRSSARLGGGAHRAGRDGRVGPDRRRARHAGGAHGRDARRVGSRPRSSAGQQPAARSEEHTSELQSREKLVCRLLLEKKK